MNNFLPCPNCGEAEEYSWGPPDMAGGERFPIDAAYCECGWIYYLVQYIGDKARTFKEVKDEQ